jgi:hypothetical protein
MNELVISRILSPWMCLALSFTIYFVVYDGAADYKVGPNPEFLIFTVAIDTPLKYTGVVCYCCINAAF